MKIEVFAKCTQDGDYKTFLSIAEGDNTSPLSILRNPDARKRQLKRIEEGDNRKCEQC